MSRKDESHRRDRQKKEDWIRGMICRKMKVTGEIDRIKVIR